jgi:hypothetical protein
MTTAELIEIAVKATILKLGISALKATSMFKSSETVKLLKRAA